MKTLPIRLEDLPTRLRGKFLVLDGPDGCGKTLATQAVQAWLEAGGVKVCRVREPGGTKFGEYIRDVLLHKKPETGEMLEPQAEMLLFMAARVQLVRQVIGPALLRGETVISDRFVCSTLAYQGSGLGVPWEDILGVAKQIIPKRYWPYCTVLLDVPKSVAQERINAKGVQADRIEEREDEFRENVRLGYLKQAAVFPEYTVLVDASGSPGDTLQAIQRRLARFVDYQSSKPFLG